MDEFLDTDLPGSDCIATNHRCACDLDHDIFGTRRIARIQYLITHLPSRPEPRFHETKNHCTLTTSSTAASFYTNPLAPFWDAVLECFHTSEDTSTFQFPDQDFLDHFFPHA